MAATHISVVIDCLSGLASARPAASLAGILYFATDTGVLSRDTGTAWEPIRLDASRIVRGEIALRMAVLVADDTPAVAKSGTLYTVLHAAPADADLAAGDCVLWFDQTNGAGKLMVKAKTANGTVATAAVALA